MNENKSTTNFKGAVTFIKTISIRYIRSLYCGTVACEVKVHLTLTMLINEDVCYYKQVSHLEKNENKYIKNKNKKNK